MLIDETSKRPPEHGHRLAPRLLRMTADRLRRGSIEGLRCLQFTSLLITRFYWGLLLSLNWWDILDEQVLLGGALMFDDLERLRGQGVNAMVNLCAELPDNWPKLHEAHIEYLWLPVLDTFPPTVEQLRQGVIWIEQQVQARRTVYIHCAAGVGRSATLAACWYVYAKGMRVPQALQFLQLRRPQVTLTRRQIRRLREFASLLNRRTAPSSRVKSAKGLGMGSKRQARKVRTRQRPRGQGRHRGDDNRCDR